MCGARAWTESRLTKLGVRYRNIPGMEQKYPDPCHVVVASEISMHFLVRDVPRGFPEFHKGRSIGTSSPTPPVALVEELAGRVLRPCPRLAAGIRK